MTRVALSIALAAALAGGAGLAADVMNERQARVAAAKILKGDPYGNSFDEVMRNIESAQLVTAGSVCGSRVTKPLWQFNVFVPKSRNPSGENDIKGYLVIDGRTGRMICAGLPFLD